MIDSVMYGRRAHHERPALYQLQGSPNMTWIKPLSTFSDLNNLAHALPGNNHEPQLKICVQIMGDRYIAKQRLVGITGGADRYYLGLIGTNWD